MCIRDSEDVATFLGTDQNFEAVELRVEEGSKLTKSKIRDLKLSRDVLVGAFVRDDEASIVRGSSQLQANDTVLLIAPPEQVDSIRKEYFISEIPED